VVLTVGGGTAAVRHAVQPAQLVAQATVEEITVELHPDVAVAREARGIGSLEEQQTAARNKSLEVEGCLALADEHVERRAGLVRRIPGDQARARAGELLPHTEGALSDAR